AALQTSSSGASGSWSLAWNCSASPRNYNYKRYYQPGMGRYLGVDPDKSTDTYAYARSNPLIFTDPTGDNPFIVAAGLVIAAGAVAGGVAFTGATLANVLAEILDAVESGESTKSISERLDVILERQGVIAKGICTSVGGHAAAASALAGFGGLQGMLTRISNAVLANPSRFSSATVNIIENITGAKTPPAIPTSLAQLKDAVVINIAAGAIANRDRIMRGGKEAVDYVEDYVQSVKDGYSELRRIIEQR
ncbi:MAG: hypothetical protein D6712_07970, partial [Chloroflexi bacterium]